MKRSLLTSALLLALAGTASAAEYYKWVDASGVTRYAEKPPAGVNAQRVTTYGGSAPTNFAQGKEEMDEAKHREQVEAKARELEAKEQEQCKKVESQLATLKERGRVRMKDAEGNERVLTEEEHAAKIIELEEYMKSMCTKEGA